MQTVYKYILEYEDVQDIRVPRWAKVLSVSMQPGDNKYPWSTDTPVLYMLVDPDEQVFEERTVRFVGTGRPRKDPLDELNFVGTITSQDHKFFWHIFVDGYSLEKRQMSLPSLEPRV